MLTNRSKFFTAGCLLVLLLFCITGVATVNWYKKSTECFKNRPPLRSFVITIGQSQQKLLIEQAQTFGKKYGFEFNIVYYTPQGDDFLIDLIRKDVEITITNTSSDTNEFYISFANYDCVHPTIASDIEGLVSNLKASFAEIPNVNISEEK